MGVDIKKGGFLTLVVWFGCQKDFSLDFVCKKDFSLDLFVIKRF